MTIPFERRQNPIHHKASRLFGQRIVNIRFQLKFSLTIFFLICLALFFTWIQGEWVVKHFTDSGMINTAQTAMYFQMINKIMVITGGIFMFIAYIIILVFSHQIAGPIYRIEKVLGAMKKGNLTMHVRFRKRDELKEIADLFNEALHYLRTSISSERNETNALIAELENLAAEYKSIDSSQAVLQLKQICTRLRAIPHNVVVDASVNWRQ